MSKVMLCPRCWGAKKDPDLGPQYDCAYCKAQGSVKDVQLSNHFWLSEFLVSQTAIRRVIPNDPPDHYIDRLKTVATDLLEPIRNQFGPIKINSGYRSNGLNAALSGSSKTSAHMLCWATDFDPIDSKVKHKSVVDWVIASDLEYDQVIYEGTWIHIGRYGPNNAVRKQNLMMFPDETGKVRYYPYVATDSRLVL